MFTAKITNKTKVANGNLMVTVGFTDGTDTYSENIQPQNKGGFDQWVKARIESLNTAKELELEDNLEKELSFTELVVELTAEEEARDTWLAQWRVYEKANGAMKSLTQAGIEATAEETTRFNVLKTWVGDNRKPEYSQFI
jgi:hypothetical protein